MQEYRELTEEEQGALLALYDKHNGNVKAVAEDNDSIFKNRNQVAHYRDKYDFSGKLSQIVAERAEEFRQRWQDKLERGKTLAIDRALSLLEIEEKEIIEKDGSVIIKVFKPSHLEIKTAWEIIKAELGEPTSVTKTQADDGRAAELENIRTNLLVLINNVKDDHVKTETATTNRESQEGEPISV